MAGLASDWAPYRPAGLAHPVKSSSFLSVFVASPQQRRAVSAPAFVRRLARLGDLDPTSPAPSLSERLGQWLDWNRAIALSRALDGTPVTEDRAVRFDDEATACARARATLQGAIMRTDRLDAWPGEDVAPFRRHCLDLQRAMQATTGQLRGRLRDALAAGTATQARLAEVDAVMETTLSPREQALLAATPALLCQHFDRLRGAAPSTDAAWLATFRRDLQDILLAELDVRFHPIDALLAALRSSHASGTP
ncbi:DUF3348 family protein [Pseudoxanthomonas sp. LjRoot168]